MNWFTSKQREIEAKLEQYRQECALCVTLSCSSLAQYCAEGDLHKLDRELVRAHQAERNADELRRSIEIMMYSKALFPESRGDVLLLLETLDTMPNQAETAVRSAVTQAIVIPTALHAQFTELLHVCSRCVETALECSSLLFRNLAEAASLLGHIHELEGQADAIEAQLIRAVFADEQIAPLDKILLRDLVREVSAVCDMAEEVSDRIRIIVAKRMV